jgi:aminoglycoside phosphotransferase (APT) family kinase protein
MNQDKHKAFERVVDKVAPGGRLVRTWELEGGVSAQTVAVEFERADGSPEKVVVRLHGAVDRAGNPDIAADEFRLHEIIQSAGISVPKPLYLDTSCELFEIPYLVIAFVDGETVLEPDDRLKGARLLAEQLAAIHQVDWSAFDLTFLPGQAGRVAARLRQRPELLDEPLSEGRIREALEADWPPAASNATILLHGDYWPGNLLWKDGEIAAVIDWEDAATGDPLADLGNCRLELCWTWGSDAMSAFTERYRELMPSLDYTNLPLWDLYAALHPAGKMSGWGLDSETTARMVGDHRQFVDHALAELVETNDE